uniref:RNA-directed DNA polymerase n=1 Tax=Schizaphis graminum TaxID=13262 RepID=A0A2S2PES7_SCHGA
MIPLNIAALLIKETHEIYGHMGTFKIYKILQTNYQIPCMYRLVKKIIKTCDLCQRSKISNQLSRGPLISQIPLEPKQRISVDLMGPLPRGQLGAQYILAILDIFSKHVKLYALRKATTVTILKKVTEDYLPRFGPIKQILTDNGTQFQNNKWKNRLKELGIHVYYTTTYNPEGNPVERVNREIGRILRAYCHKKHTTWVQYLDNIEYWLNNSTHESTGYTPEQIRTGKKTPLSIDKLVPFPETNEAPDHKLIIQLAYNKLKKTSRLRNKLKDENKKFPQYVNGQEVLVKEHKLSSAAEKQIYKLFLLYKGPYTINSVNDNNTVTILDDHGQQSTHNFRNIRPYVPPDPGEYLCGKSFL